MRRLDYPISKGLLEPNIYKSMTFIQSLGGHFNSFNLHTNLYVSLKLTSIILTTSLPSLRPSHKAPQHVFLVDSTPLLCVAPPPCHPHLLNIPVSSQSMQATTFDSFQKQNSFILWACFYELTPYKQSSLKSMVSTQTSHKPLHFQSSLNRVRLPPLSLSHLFCFVLFFWFFW